MVAMLHESSVGDMTDDMQQRVAMGLNEMLKELGYPPSAISGWWNTVPLAELGGRTATQAWVQGDQDAVRDLIVNLREQSMKAARNL